MVVFAQVYFNVFMIIPNLLNERMHILALYSGSLLFEYLLFRAEFLFVYSSTNNNKLTIVRLSLRKMLITY